MRNYTFMREYYHEQHTFMSEYHHALHTFMREYSQPIGETLISSRCRNHRDAKALLHNAQKCFFARNAEMGTNTASTPINVQDSGVNTRKF